MMRYNVRKIYSFGSLIFYLYPYEKLLMGLRREVEIIIFFYKICFFFMSGMKIALANQLKNALSLPHYRDLGVSVFQMEN